MNQDQNDKTTVPAPGPVVLLISTFVIAALFALVMSFTIGLTGGAAGFLQCLPGSMVISVVLLVQGLRVGYRDGRFKSG